MPIKITCKCGQGFTAKEHLAGRILKCPKCASPLKIPQPQRPEESVEPQQCLQPTPTAKQAQPKQPQQLKPPDAMPDLLAEAGLPAAPPPNLCPSCRNAMPPGAILCVHCGYHQQLGRKVDTKLGSAATPRTPAASADAATGAAPKKGPLGLVTAGLNVILPKKGTLKLVATGLNLIFWGVVLYLIAVPLGLLSPLVFTRWALSAVSVVCSGATLVATLLRIVGCILCLNVPKESSAKGLILAVVIMEPLAVLMSFGLVPGVYRHAGYILSGAATVVFIFFLKQLAGYLKRSDLADQALSLITGGICMVGVSIVAGVVAGMLAHLMGTFSVVGGLGSLGGLILLVYVIYLVVQYVTLLRSLCQEILSRTRR